MWFQLMEKKWHDESSSSLLIDKIQLKVMSANSALVPQMRKSVNFLSGY